MEYKAFTLEQANKAIPVLNVLLDEISGFNEQIKQKNADIKSLEHIWGKDILNKSHVDNSLYLDYTIKRSELLAEVRSRIAVINDIGCCLKDIEKGLVDFHFSAGSRVVSLCWKKGEPEIKYWHALGAGYAGRLPIEELIVVAE